MLLFPIYYFPVYNHMMRLTLCLCGVYVPLGHSLAAQSHYVYDSGEPAAENFPVPVRWTAIEVILEQKFSEASDVWSYGVRGPLVLRPPLSSIVVHSVALARVRLCCGQ